MTRSRKMASSSSKEVDHGNYVPTPVPSRGNGPGHPSGPGEVHPRSAAAEYRLSPADAPGRTDGVVFVDEGSVRKVYLMEGSVQSHGRKGRTGLPEMDRAFVVGAGAKLDITVIVLPGCSARIPITIDLTGEGAEVLLKGIYLCSGTDEVTFDIIMHHRAEGCTSRQLFNGLAAGSSQCAFFGKIIVAPEAQKTEAYQENHNIVLSDDASVNTKPRLEIYADDVKCSHGATVGKLNEDEQFYMRSRGIPEDEAKVLQMISFVAPVLQGIDDRKLVLKIEKAVRSLARNKAETEGS